MEFWQKSRQQRSSRIIMKEFQSHMVENSDSCRFNLMLFFKMLNKQQSQLQNVHFMLMHHQEQTHNLESKQQRSVHDICADHVNRQYSTKLNYIHFLICQFCWKQSVFVLFMYTMKKNCCLDSSLWVTECAHDGALESNEHSLTKIVIYLKQIVPYFSCACRSLNFS